jgi:multisubunit Na+/H+ antiporter MnhB subunit
MVLVAGYLLWTGKHAPGGAFQAGAILGAAGVLYLLSDIRIGTMRLGWPFRTILIIGFVVFLAVAIGATVIGGRLLEYPQNWAGDLILLVEAAVAVSTALTLALFFAGGRPSGSSESPSNSNARKHPKEETKL